MKKTKSAILRLTPYQLYQRICASLIVLLVLAQLFHFEQLPGAFVEMGVPNYELLSRFVAMLIVIVELAALPYLIGMPLSKRWMRLSRASVLGIGLVWVAVVAWSFGAGATDSVAAVFGTALSITSGEWLLWFAILFAVLLSFAVIDPERLVQRFGLSHPR